MPIVALDHYTISTPDLDRSVAFYETAIGLRRGPRPPFDFPGAWLYAGGHPIVHLFVDDAPRATSGGPDAPGATSGGPYAPGAAQGEPDASSARTGALDHIAFAARDIAATMAHLDSTGIEYRHQRVPGSTLQQLFFTDPDGIRIELNFADG